MYICLQPDGIQKWASFGFALVARHACVQPPDPRPWARRARSSPWKPTVGSTPSAARACV